MFIVNNTKFLKNQVIIFTLNFTALNSVQMQPLFTAQSPPNAGLFQFPLAGNYTQVGGMPMEICSLRPDSKMCRSHLGRRARERRWQVSPPSLSPHPCLGVWWSGPAAPPSRGGGADSWTQNHTLQTGSCGQHSGLGTEWSGPAPRCAAGTTGLSKAASSLFGALCALSTEKSKHRPIFCSPWQ